MVPDTLPVKPSSRQVWRGQAILQLMRPHQWIKNGFVLLGLVFSHRWTEGAMLSSVGLVLLAFCLMASAVYVYNDLMDVESDRLHPTKCRRPIASGLISVATARSVCAVLSAGGLLCAAQVSWSALGLLGFYAVMNIAYSHKLKHMVLIDVFVISTGFMLRILIGTVGVGIAPSSWLLLCGMMMTLFLGFAKRRAELLAAQTSGLPARKVLADYSPAMLDQILAVTAGCTVLSYALYTVSPETVRLHRTTQLIYTVPFLVYGIFRYLYLLHGQGSGQDTARDLLTDRHLLVTLTCWLAVTLVLIA